MAAPATAQIATLIKFVLEDLQATFGSNKLLSAYLTGSYAQGLARPESDLDIVLVLNSQPTRRERDTYRRVARKLNAQWCPRLAYQIDLGYILTPFASDYSTIRQRFILQLTGQLINGRPIANDLLSEVQPAVIAAAFRAFHLAHIPAIPVNDSNALTRTFARRAKAKYLLRGLEWIAVLAGAPLSCTTSEFVGHIKRFAPEHEKDGELCWHLYQQDNITDLELPALLSKEQPIVAEFDHKVSQALVVAKRD